MFSYNKTWLLALVFVFFSGCWDNKSTITATTENSNDGDLSGIMIGTQPIFDTTIIIENNLSSTEPNSTTPTVELNTTSLSVDAGSDKTARIGELVTLVARVEGVQNDLNYSWSENGIELGKEQYLSKSDWSIGVHTITLTINNQDQNRASDEVLVTIEDKLLIEDKTLTEKNGWESIIKVGHLAIHKKSASIESVTYECGGDLIYIDTNNSGYLFNEELLYGLQNCAAGCQVWLSEDGSSYQKYCNEVLVTSGKLSTPLDVELYERIGIEAPSAGMDHNATDIFYASSTGMLYALDVETGSSTFIAPLTQNYLVNGLAYLDHDIYYYSYTVPPSEANQSNYASYLMEKVDLNSSKLEQNITDITSLNGTPFPDGLDIYNEKIYSVTNDVSGVVTIFDLNGTYLETLETTIDDIVGISHTQYFLYILSEDGDIYQTNPQTGESKRIFNNNNLFEKGNNNNGLEAITILNSYIYLSYINDSSIYRIDVNLTQYE